MPSSAGPEPPLVAVVVLAWNGWEDTRACLASLRAATYERRLVILVDNGSSDDTAARARAEFPEVEVLETGDNLGFSAGNNRGIARALEAGADYVMLLNNDTTAEPGFVEPLLEAFEREAQLGFASPTILYADEPRVWFGGGEIDWRTGWAYHAPSQAEPPAGGLRRTPFVTGCCLIARRETWEQVGLLDPRFFLFWEDTEWSVRAGRAGHAGAVVAGSRIRHKVSASFHRGMTGLGTFYFVRNGLLFIREHAPRPLVTSLRFLLLWAVRPSLREARRWEPGWWRYALLRTSGVLAHLCRSYGPAPAYARRLAAQR